MVKKTLTALSVVFLILGCVFGQQPMSADKFRLAKINFVGLQRISEAKAVTYCGLQLGQTVGASDLAGAAAELKRTGLFSKAKYSYSFKGDDGFVTFTVEEANWTAPIVFDNFVWFKDEELLAAVREILPGSDGLAPATDGVGLTIAPALSRLLQQRNLPGQVDYVGDMTRGTVHVFSVKGIDLPVCALHFPGATAVPESELVKASKQILDNGYSRSFAFAYANGFLDRPFRKVGHLRAKFLTPNGQLDQGACSKGVVVNIPVEEGLAYNWGTSEWTGNSLYTGQELERALQMKPGDLADGLKIDEGFKNIKVLFAAKGRIGLKLSIKNTFDDNNRLVSYQIAVTEGPEYHMGAISFVGVSPADASLLKSEWKLSPGGTYNGDYLKQFIAGVLPRKLGPGPHKINPEVKPDHDKLTVDVIIRVS